MVYKNLLTEESEHFLKYSVHDSVRRRNSARTICFYVFIFMLSLMIYIYLREPRIHFINPTVDALDGIGFSFKDKIYPKLDKRYEIINNMDSCDYSENGDPVINDPKSIWKEFYNCIHPVVQQWKGKAKEMNMDWVAKTEKCDKLRVFEKLEISPFTNGDEVKWVILPKCKENNTMVTIGIGHDTLGEEKLNMTLPNTKFYGADPIIEPNIHLYSAFGQFFPFAIGGKAGIKRFNVLPNSFITHRRYSWQDVTTIDILYFFKNILNLTKIDIAWIDCESAEFEYLDYFYKGGEFDKNNITFCQFNIEIHSKFNINGEQIFHDFVFRMLEDKRYIFLKPMYTTDQVHRMFFVNIEDQECVRKFIK